MTYGELLRFGGEFLRERGVAEAETDAWYLLAFCTGFDRTKYLLRKAEAVPEEPQERYQALLKKRGERVPLQYLTGEQEFMGFPFLVNEDVLIPRQDTEVLAEEARRLIKPGWRVLDLCTGSGCILISLLKLCPGAVGTGADISGRALRVARENAARLGVEAEFVESDLFESVNGSYDMIVSNPPYIPTDALDGLMEEVRLHEPRLALDGDADGLRFYRGIIAKSGGYLRPGGWLLFEIGHDQGARVAALMENVYTQIRIVTDLAGLDRVVLGRYSPDTHHEGS